MAFFRDLADCDYLPVDNVKLLAVGWLDSREPYQRGEAEANFLEQLALIIELSAPVNPGWGGVHFCELESCQTPRSNYLKKFRLGNSEIVLASERPGQYYCAPNLIYHYITAHNYVPPREFELAVLKFRPEDLVEIEAYPIKTRINDHGGIVYEGGFRIKNKG